MKAERTLFSVLRLKMREKWPLGVSVQKRAPNYASAAAIQKITVVSNWRKAEKKCQQVRAGKVNESEPTEDASKI